jgi:hypothetical protein
MQEGDGHSKVRILTAKAAIWHTVYCQPDCARRGGEHDAGNGRDRRDRGQVGGEDLWRKRGRGWWCGRRIGPGRAPPLTAGGPNPKLDWKCRLGANMGTRPVGRSSWGRENRNPSSGRFGAVPTPDARWEPGEFLEKLEGPTQRRLAPQKGGRKPNSKTRQEDWTLQNWRHTLWLLGNVKTFHLSPVIGRGDRPPLGRPRMSIFL